MRTSRRLLTRKQGATLFSHVGAAFTLGRPIRGHGISQAAVNKLPTVPDAQLSPNPELSQSQFLRSLLRVPLFASTPLTPHDPTPPHPTLTTFDPTPNTRPTSHPPKNIWRVSCRLFVPVREKVPRVTTVIVTQEYKKTEEAAGKQRIHALRGPGHPCARTQPCPRWVSVAGQDRRSETDGSGYDSPEPFLTDGGPSRRSLSLAMSSTLATLVLALLYWL
ncbi:unnamed protein product [Lota lota]